VRLGGKYPNAQSIAITADCQSVLKYESRGVASAFSNPWWGDLEVYRAGLTSRALEWVRRGCEKPRT